MASHKGKLSRFKLRNIYAIASTTIKLAYWCINLAKHRQHKAEVKVHMVANVANRLPHFCVYGKANEHDSRKEEMLFESLKAGDIGILDRAYNCFKTLHKQSERGVIFAVQLFALRRIYPSHHVAEKGSYAEPLVLWDSTSPGKRSPTRKCAVSAGICEDVCKVYGIAECQFQGDPRESSKSINTRV